MNRTNQSPIWPFLLVVAFLFLLCIVAPRQWQRIAHRRSAPVASSPVDQVPDDTNFAAMPFSTLAEPLDNIAVDNVAAPIESVTSELDAASDDSGPESDPPQESPAAQELTVSESSLGDTTASAANTINTVDDANVAPTTDDAISKPSLSPSDASMAAERLSEKPPKTAPAPAVHAAAPPAAPRGPRWSTPQDLLARLENLSCECDCADWATQVTQLIVELYDETTPIDERAAAILAKLRAAAESVDPLVPQIAERSVAIELLRVRHSLVRRLDVWDLMPQMFGQQTQQTAPGPAATKRLTEALDQLDAITRSAGAEGQQWRTYLALDMLRSLADTQAPSSDSEGRLLAREVRTRLTRSDLTDSQRQFINSKPVAELAHALQAWTLEAFDPARLLANLERFELTSQPSDARRVADDYLASASLAETGDELTQRLEANYRNANLRLALSEKLLKRLLPGASMTTDSVSDRILGLPTHGMSTTSTKVDVKLVPDAHRLRVALEARGQVLANTRSTSGPATLYTHSDSSYEARKVVDLDLRGIRTWPAESECYDSRTRLRSVSTNFDGVPLVGALVETVARSKHADQEDEVRSILRRKVEAQARRKMDTLTEERLGNLNRMLRERVVAPLDGMALDPQVISAETSEQRLTMRLRLAGEEQLAGHTPRPRAPGDSLLSLQIHQSLFNNICEQLDLNGRTFTLSALREHIIQRLNLQNSRFLDATDRDVSITFANMDAMRVHCEDGRIELNLAVARLSNEERTWKNFHVRVFYRPEVEGLQAKLVRDGTVQLIGSRLAAQFPLRGIFSKAFAKDRDLVLVDPKWSSDERTRDLAFSQFVIQDGWIAVAVAEPRQNIARQPLAGPAR